MAHASEEFPGMNRIGQRLRGLRELFGLSMRDVAERTDLSAAYISQLENGKAVPSLKVLQRLGDSFGKSVGYFFEDSRSEDQVMYFPREKQIELSSQNGFRRVRILAPGERLEVNPMLVTLEPGNVRETEPSSHEGWEFVYMIAGEVRLHVGDRVIEARAGDAFCFKSAQVHLAENTGTETAVGLTVGFHR